MVQRIIITSGASVSEYSFILTNTTSHYTYFVGTLGSCYGLNQVRILQAVGLALLVAILGGIITGIILSSRGIPLDNLVLAKYMLIIMVITELLIGFWLGRKLTGSGRSLLGHIYFANVLFSLLNVILSFFLGQVPFWFTILTPLTGLVLSVPAVPAAFLARRKRKQ